MKKIKTTAALAATVFALGAMTFSSCDAINKASERDIEVNDFDFTIDTSGVLAAAANESGTTRTDGTTRADGVTHFAGSATISRDDLLAGTSFDFDMIKNVTIGGVEIGVEQDLTGVVIESLSLTCTGVPSVEMTDVPIADIGTSQQDALRVFASGLFMAAVRDGEVTVSLDVTFSEPITEEMVSYLITLSEIVVRAGLNL
jgi:hypothetical protein